MAKIKEKWIEDGAVAVGKLKTDTTPSAGQIPEVNSTDPTKVDWVDKPSGGTDGKDVKVSAGDTTAGFLDGKIVIDAGKLTKTKQNAGANETLLFGIGADVFDKTTDDTDDITEGTKKFYSDSLVSTYLGTQKGAANGLAELGADSKVPAAQLPSYVDDVLEYDNQAAFPATGETGKIYVAKDTNITYRWSGTVYVEISASLALGETSATAYRGDRGKIAYDHSQTAHAPSDAEANLTEVTEVLTLDATDISNKYKDLTNVPAFATAVLVTPVGGPQQQYTVDFTIITDGAANKRLNWSTLGLDGVLEATDKLMVHYSY